MNLRALFPLATSAATITVSGCTGELPPAPPGPLGDEADPAVTRPAEAAAWRRVGELPRTFPTELAVGVARCNQQNDGTIEAAFSAVEIAASR